MLPLLKSCGVPLLVGSSVGVIFSLMRLPIPAPPSLPGVLGIVGVFLGYLVVHRFIS